MKPLIVVVIDDEETVNRFVRKALSGSGCDVYEATEGQEGIRTILELKPDIVILDVKIPIVHGYEVCRYIKKHPDTRRAKVIMVSGLVTGQDRTWARSCGADDFIQKPFDRDELILKVADVSTRSN